MQYGFLSAVFVLCVLGSWASFTDRVRQGNYYVGLMAWVSVSTGLLFAWGCQWLNHKGRIFVFSLQYDIAMIVAYYALPLALGWCRVPLGTLFGALLILSGLLLIHLTGEHG